MKWVEGAAVRRLRRWVIVLLCAAGSAAPSVVAHAQQEDAGPIEATEPAARVDGAAASIHGSVASPAAEALGPGWIARVAAVGLVRVTGAELAARGAPTEFGRLCLRWRGQVLPLHAVDGDSDGLIESNEEVRFYAPGAGDRYNDADAYWFSDDQTCHRAMPARSANLVGGSTYVTVRQRGEWRERRYYQEPQGGPDGDHWFADSLLSDDATEAVWAFDVSASDALPAILGEATYTVTGAARMNRAHAARVVGNGWNASATWSGVGVFTVAVHLASAAVPTGFVLQAGAIDVVLPDAVYWDRPALLVPGTAGARFATNVSGDHSVTGASESQVYDVSAPLLPKVITLASGKFFATARGQYIVPGTATVTTAALTSYALQSGEDLRVARNAAAVYIAPRAWLSALEPLLTRRRVTVGSATAVPVEAIYAQFGHGQATPQAIREFLRYAYTTWTLRPKGVVLVGDASFDVRDYAGHGFPMILPPYLADIDSNNGEAGERGETACESCFAQLDYADPLADAVPELIYGRIPAQTSAQLAAYVAKVVAYETSTSDAGPGTWRGNIAYLADDTIHPDGTLDTAGDFWRTAEKSIAEQNFYTGIRRLYYDPTGALGNRAHTVGPRTLTSNPANDRTHALFEAGAAFVTYIGHASANQIGKLDENNDRPGNYLLNQNQVDSLMNAGRLPILLQMTCLTGAYTYRYVDGTQRVSTSFDERIVLASGGAVAAWGSTGLGVAVGHDIMLRGFFAALWGSGGRSLTLGELAQAGYLQLYAAPEAPFGGDLIRTYLIIGDAFLQPRVYAPRVLLPSEVRRVNIALAVR